MKLYIKQFKKQRIIGKLKVGLLIIIAMISISLIVYSNWIIHSKMPMIDAQIVNIEKTLTNIEVNYVVHEFSNHHTMLMSDLQKILLKSGVSQDDEDLKQIEKDKEEIIRKALSQIKRLSNPSSEELDEYRARLLKANYSLLQEEMNKKTVSMNSYIDSALAARDKVNKQKDDLRLKALRFQIYGILMGQLLIILQLLWFYGSRHNEYIEIPDSNKNNSSEKEVNSHTKK